jgi:cysteinyl-tRNA synthetase
MMGQLKFYNTLTRRKEDFAPLDAANVRVYACGPTVYDHLHIGNGRMLVVFDILFRLLRFVYGPDHVTYVRNITDVDDKINTRSAERGVPIDVLTQEMTAIFHADAAALGCLPPTFEPRATQHIGEMIKLITRLIDRGHAYAAQAHVLFDVPTLVDYGTLAHRSLDEMIAGARVEVAPYKRNPTDFVLWKPSLPTEPGWDSPWGRGRPGWHIECSAMSWKYLGEIFDIHGGGIDLVFPHHENELAQTRCAFGHAIMAQVWMHNGHLQVKGDKMSKSLGNFVTIRDLWQGSVFGGRRWDGAVLRFALLRAHYRQPTDISLKALEEAEKTLLSWAALLPEARWNDPSSENSAAVVAALSDDLNTPLAITYLHQLAVEARNGVELARIQLRNGALLLGLDLGELSATIEQERVLRRDADPEWVASINQLVTARNAARVAKDWLESDRIRNALLAMGVVLKDLKDGTSEWEPRR